MYTWQWLLWGLILNRNFWVKSVSYNLNIAFIGYRKVHLGKIFSSWLSALANAGLGQEDVTDIGCTLDGAAQQYTVTFTFQDIHNTAMVDAATFTVLSSVQS